MDYNTGFDNIDWEAMHTEGNNDEYIKHVKMTECLTDNIVTINNFHCIYVKDEEIKRIVENKLRKYGIMIQPPYIDTQIWF